MRYLRGLVIVSLLFTALLTACGDNNSDEKLPEARPLLEEAAGKVQGAQSFKIQITVTGYPVPLTDFLTFQGAEGAYVAPDKLQAKAEVNLEDVGTIVDIIVIGQVPYINHQNLTGGAWLKDDQYTLIPAGFSPQALMSSDTGIAHALKSIKDLKMVGKEDKDGLYEYHLKGTIQPSDVNALTFGLIGTQSGLITVEVYISADERQIDEIVLREPLPEGVQNQEPTTWTIGLYDYDKPVDIQAPVE
jgi:hypothetical protein